MRKNDFKENKKTNHNNNGGSSTKLPPVNKKINQNQNVTLNTSNYQDQGLIGLMHEYFIKNNFFDTLDIFQRDCLKGFKVNTKPLDTIKNQLMQSFDSGNRETFFIRFVQYVPLNMRLKDIQTMRMEFYLQLYFFIYSIHPILGKKKTVDATAKSNFISYLEGRGSILAKQTEFLQYYALAYLQKPQQHPNFKTLFTREWIQQLRKRLAYFIDKLYLPGKTPTLIHIYDRFIERNLERSSSLAMTEQDQQLIQEQIQQNYQQNLANNPQPILLQNNNNRSNPLIANLSGTNHEPINQQLPPEQIEELMEKQLFTKKINELQQQKIGLLNFIEKSKNKYQNLENDFRQFSGSIQNTLRQSQLKWFKITQQLYNVAKDLLGACKNLQEGIPLVDKDLISKRGQKLSRYESFMKMNVQDLLSDNVADYSLFQRPDHDLSTDMVKKNEYYQMDQKQIQVDYPKIKQTLARLYPQNASEEQKAELDMEKCLLLQALRWRLTRIRGSFQKRQVFMGFTLNDILGFNANDNTIYVLLDCPNQTVVYYTILFISALSKDYYGRQYFFNVQFIEKLIEMRRSPAIDQKIKEMILVIFQLQSIRKSTQNVLIEHGLVKQIVEKLDKQRDSMSVFIMQYATALLCNLLLSKKGLEKAEQIKSQILTTLINLMETQSPSVKSFVHASLFPLFSKKTIRQKALQFGMEANIKYLIQNDLSMELQHQLKYIHQRLLMEDDIVDQRQEEPELDEINDDQIGEDLQEDSQQINNPSLEGQFLLMKKYPLIGPQSITQMNMIKQQTKATFQRSIFYQNSVQDRMSVQTPLLGKNRKLTHNNSVYSNKSSNRVLKSQKNSRLKNTSKKQRERLDTVHQNGSEASIRQYNPNSVQQKNIFGNNFSSGNFGQNEQKKYFQMQNAQGTFRQKHQQSMVQSRLQRSFVNENQIHSTKQINSNNKGPAIENEKQKYEKTEEYKSAFQTRALLVRTPPQK